MAWANIIMIFNAFCLRYITMHSAAPSGSWCGGQRQLSAANGSPV